MKTQLHVHVYFIFSTDFILILNYTKTTTILDVILQKNAITLCT